MIAACKDNSALFPCEDNTSLFLVNQERFLFRRFGIDDFRTDRAMIKNISSVCSKSSSTMQDAACILWAKKIAPSSVWLKVILLSVISSLAAWIFSFSWSTAPCSDGWYTQVEIANLSSSRQNSNSRRKSPWIKPLIRPLGSVKRFIFVAHQYCCKCSSSSLAHDLLPSIKRKSAGFTATTLPIVEELRLLNTILRLFLNTTIKFLASFLCLCAFFSFTLSLFRQQEIVS